MMVALFFSCNFEVVIGGGEHSVSLYCFDQHSFVIQFETKKFNASTFYLIQDYFRYLVSSGIKYELQDCFSIFVKNIPGILLGIAFNLQMALGRMNILTVLTINEHWVSFHLFESFLFLSSIFNSFVCTNFSPLMKFIYFSGF